ncbi:taurine dehydrogenase large subunit [Sinorhizobium kostiense]|uniref:Taurine dehydrogenase large subunit n=1 Tax=Sinorhizobium kostiense TaxID=76747 RepID=A0ABS4QW44_9HYPH|nr:FAD-binding oxidoreductase [Sinorhizobium kostiense]MBP2234371.1 taurine dehydrogenase large subunit [Sinorhizobium kostiense]
MYDPLVHVYPNEKQPDPASYWMAISGPGPEDDGRVEGDVDADVVVIGGGYTGLSAALSLARDHGLKPVVLEARSSAWGCSGRNGSFARISGGRVAAATMVNTYGKDVARAYFGEMRQALGTVRQLIADGNIDCDVQPDGVYKVAAFAAHASGLEREAALYNEIFNYPARLVPAGELKGAHRGAEAFGALHFPDGFSMNPLKLARGVHMMARSHGALIHTHSPVTAWHTENGVHRLLTPSGSVRTRKVVVATNGYTSSKLHPRLSARVLPVYSQIIVTEPMTSEQIGASLPSGNCMFDTRSLLFYYRRLPDGRMLFGGRSAIAGSDAENPKHRRYLTNAMIRKFPALEGIAIDYWWGGWVAVSRNSLPFVYRVPGLPEVFWGGGYAGSGVSFSLHVGTKLALMAAGKPFDTQASFLTREPKRYPLPPFLRLGQRIAYRWLHAKDQRQASAK